ncbi:diguanylate cyclase [Acanthopleuribacter pedis]|uniref:diguanylate cyclase n=1 Tax=Acanthopleuribacter pedis TaxID=442870 RepID=A0A8J7U4T7_9BACT|nr:diguanylate cyclase [Acanthopleuribacter pedis]MBO1321798.1 diguanylate cyclase [Acanthopleuribacter pedis]
MDQAPAQKLTQQYNRITIGGTVIMLLLVSVLFYGQFQEQQKHHTEMLQDQLNDRLAAMDTFLAGTPLYIEQMHLLMTYYLDMAGAENNDTPLPHPGMVDHITQKDDIGFTFDNPPRRYDITRYGNLMGAGSFAERYADPLKQREILAAISLFPLLKASHEAMPHFSWSYYQSADEFVAIYPWRSTRDMIADQPDRTVGDLVRSAIALDLFQLGTPEKNRDGASYWTSAYDDPAGKGLMISHGKPVFWQDRFLGVVATDIKLNSLQHYTEELEAPSSILTIVDGQGHALSSNKGPRVYTGNPLPLRDLLPDALKPHEAEIMALDGQALFLGHLVLRRESTAAPWSMIVIIPRQALYRDMLFGFAGYLSILLGLCFFLIILYVLLQRRFLRPALALTDLIRAEAQDGHSRASDVPDIWRPWFDKVSDTFALKTVTANLPGAVFQVYRQAPRRFSFRFATQGIEQFSGVSDSNITGDADIWSQFLPDEERRRLFQELENSQAQNRPIHFETPFGRNGFRRGWIRLSANPRHDERGNTVWEGLLLDITDQKNAEWALRQSEERLRSILDASLFPIVITRESDKRIVFINDRGSILLETRKDEGTDSYGSDYWVNLEDRENMIAEITEKGLVEDYEAKLVKKNGEAFWALMSAMRMNYRDQPCVLITFNDITRRKSLEEELKELATTDSLTGVYNRRHFYQTALAEWQRALRFEQPISALMIDIDHFKRVNDQYGHSTGDAVIKTMAMICNESLRTIDVFGRIGGEEFCAILPNTNKDTAVQVAERLRKKIASAEVTRQGDAVRFTISVGVAGKRDTDGALEAMIERADHNLYQAKEQGRNQVVSG